MYDCHEFWPEKISEVILPGRPRLVIRIVKGIERWLAQRVDLVWVVNGLLAERFRDGPAPVVLLPNYARKSLFHREIQPPEDLSAALHGKPVLIYVGGLTESRGVTACLRALAQIRTSLPGIHMLFLGTFGHGCQDRMARMIRDLDLGDQVTVLGRIPHEQVPGFLKLADLGLFLAQPTRERYRWSEPIKYFEYMAAGLPVVMSDLQANRSLIERVGNGILVDPLDPTQAAVAIVELLLDKERMQLMRDQGLRAFQEEYNWENASKKMVESLEKCLMNHQARTG